MGNKVISVEPWKSEGTQHSLCVQSALEPVPSGVIPTVVIATTLTSCEDSGGGYKGIVFYEQEPQAWYCVAADRVDHFKTWAATTFPSVQIVMAPQPLSITCPPPPIRVSDVDLPENDPEVSSAERKLLLEEKLKKRAFDDMKEALQEMAKLWFVPAKLPQDEKRVA